jgi:hypothetical protein
MTSLPTNDYGNIDISSGVPPGLAYVEGKRLTVTCRSLGIECAPAMTGWVRGWRGPKPDLTGVVVHEKDEATLRAAIERRNQRRRTPAQKAEAKRRRQAKEAAVFAAQILARFPGMPEGEAASIASRATEIGSGRVGRSGRAKDPVLAAVIAHARHRHTDYELDLEAGVERHEARRMAGEQIAAILDQWRRVGGRASRQARSRRSISAPPAGMLLRERMRALGALRRQELAAMAHVRAVQRGRGRAAINPDYVRFVAKRAPPGVLPDAVWAFLVEGGTGLRKSDLMWAVPALAAYIARSQQAERDRYDYADADIPPVRLNLYKEQWTYLADWLLATRSKDRGPWPLAVERAHRWHQRENLAKRRREAQARMRGGKPKHKPFIRFPGGAFAVMLDKSELDMEGAASAHCLGEAYADQLNFSIRTAENIPFFSGSFTKVESGPGINFSQTKGSWNLIPPRATPYARGAWRVITESQGKIASVAALTDFAALWLPKERADQRRFDLDTLGQAGVEEVTTFVKGALVVAEPAVVGLVVSGRTHAGTAGKVIVERFEAISTQSPAAAVAFARHLSPALFAPLADLPEVPAALALMQLGTQTSRGLSERLSRRYRRAFGEPDHPEAELPAAATEALAEARSSRFRAAILGPKAVSWRRVAARSGFDLAAEMDEGGFAAWLLLAPRAVLRPLLVEAARRPEGSRLLRIISGAGEGTAGSALQEAFMYRALQLPRRDLRLLAASMPPSWREAARWIRPDIPGDPAGMVSVLAGHSPGDNSPFVGKVERLSRRSYTRLVQRIANKIDATNWDWHDWEQGSYRGDRPEEELEQEGIKVWNWGRTLWTLIRVAPHRIEAPLLLHAVGLGAALERTASQGRVVLSGPVVDALGVALAEAVDLLHAPGAPTPKWHALPVGKYHHGIVGLPETSEMLETAVTTLVGAKGAASVPAVEAVVEWVDAVPSDHDWGGWFEYYPGGEDRARHFPALVWAADLVGDVYAEYGVGSVTSQELAAGKLYADTWRLPYGPLIGAYAETLKPAIAG